ncbi:unnamed protein product [Ilex paraguariensis]|uniref:Uncharacterized protein n=1 Tax=Ilex paraguariensis TaxID=185542 RepID=A0ABC8RJ61_9AQUA
MKENKSTAKPVKHSSLNPSMAASNATTTSMTTASTLLALLNTHLTPYPSSHFPPILMDPTLVMLVVLKQTPFNDKSVIFGCDVCGVAVDKRQWVYYCAGYDFGTHLNYVKPPGLLVCQ